MTKTRRTFRYVFLGLAAITFSAITLIALNSGAMDSFRAFASPYVNPTQAEASIIPSPQNDDEIARPMLTNGKIVFQRGRNSVSRLHTIVPGGAAVPIPGPDGAQGYHPAYSPDGSKIVFVDGGAGANNGFLMLMDNNGGNIRSLPTPRKGFSPTWSPNGERLAFIRGDFDSVGDDGKGELFIIDMTPGSEGSNEVRVPATLMMFSRPSWSSTNRIAAACMRPRVPVGIDFLGICVSATIPASSQITANPPVFAQISGPNVYDRGVSWSSDGEYISFISPRDDPNLSRSEIYVVGMVGQSARRLTNTNNFKTATAFAPDGTKIAFASNANTAPYTSSLRIVNFDGSNGTDPGVLTDAGSGDQLPHWGVTASTATPTPTPTLITGEYVTTRPGQPVTISIDMLPRGGETAISFSLNFDPTKFSNPVAILGDGVTPGTVLGLNTSQVSSGKLGVLLNSTTAYTAPLLPNASEILKVRFDVLASTPSGSYPISFVSTPTLRSTSNAAGVLMPTLYQEGTLQIPSGCSFSVTPEEQVFGESSNIGVVTVTQNSPATPCPWRAQMNTFSGSSFVTILSNPFGTGSGSFSYGISANTSGSGRSAMIDIIDSTSDQRILTYFVRQTTSGGSCTYYVTPARAFYDVPGGTGSFEVIAPDGCTWTAEPQPSFMGDQPITLTSPSTGTGRAEIMYSVAANDGEHAQWRNGSVMINGNNALQHGIFQSNGGPCPMNTANEIPRLESGASQHSSGSLDHLREFRDKVLVKTSRGPKYIQDYYLYAGEITKLLIFNPSLLYRSKDALDRYRPVVDSILRREQARAEQQRPGSMVAALAAFEPTVVNDSELAEIDDLLSSVSELASVQLRQKIEAVRSDLHAPEVQAEFGVRIAHGPKRSLPSEQHSRMGMIGDLVPFDLGSTIQSLNPFAVPANVAQITQEDEPKPFAQTPANDVYGQIPLSFEANNGQVDSQVKFISRGAAYNLFLTPSEAVLALPEKVNADGNEVIDMVASLRNSQVRSSETTVRTLRMKLDGADPSPRMIALNKLEAKSNYFVGNDHRKWRTGISNYSSVQYNQVYKGVDLVYYGNQRQLEYDFKVAPGADPNLISMNFAGADRIKLSEHGDLLLDADGREVRLLAPVTYQEKDGVRHEVASRYVLRESPETEGQIQKSISVGFEVAAYDTNRPLVIDPVLVYSTYLGGSGEDIANSIAVDSAGNAYVIGYTDSTNFPVAGAIQSTYAGNPQDIFVSKLNAAGTALVYSTYLGGNGQDNGSDIAVDAAGNAYITGYTGSTNFPMANALQANRTGFFNAFVAKLNPTGSQLVYSTYYGGSIGEYGSAIAVDANGSAYVGGVTSSPDMPKTNPIQSGYGGDLSDAYVAKFNPAGTQVVYSTFLGGNGNDGVTDIAIDTAGNAYVTGVTFSTNFPIANALQPNFRGGAFDAFITKLNPAGNALVFSTYRGGTDDDRGYRIELDAANNVYVAGQTQSSDFPTASALQPTFGGVIDAFITKFNPTGTVSYSTFLGGSGLDGATGLAVSSSGNAHLTGFTTSTNFPLADPSQSVYGGGQLDAFVSKLNTAGSALTYSTYLGGGGFDTGFDIGVDPAGNAFVFGRTGSTNFPTFNPIQAANGGGALDTFITKFAPLATNVEVSGKVTTPTGLGLRNAVVAITDSQGVRRTATTGSFGLFSFDNVRTGETYTLGVSSKRYRFSTRILQISDNLVNVNFVGLE